jgi:peptide chain release factor
MSFFNVSPEKEKMLLDRMRRLGLLEKDLEEKFVRGSGRGGQKINKTSSCVVLKHIPSGLTVKCQRERSLSVNRFLARRLLLDRIEELKTGVVRSREDEREKIRRAKKRAKRRSGIKARQKEASPEPAELENL